MQIIGVKIMHKSIKLNRILFALVASGVIAGCATNLEKANKKTVDKSFLEIERVTGTLANKQEEATIRGGKAYADAKAAEQSAPTFVKKTRSAWLGTQAIPMTDEDALPAIFHEDYVFNFSDGGRPISMGVLASRLSTIVGLPVRVQPDVFSAPQSGSSSSPAAPIPAAPMIAGDSSMKTFEMPADKLNAPVIPLTQSVSFSVDQIQMQWNGTLAGFLNNITDRLGLAWEFRDNTIVIMRYVTRFYELASFSNPYEYEMNSGSTGNGSGEGLNQSSTLSVREQGKVESFTKSFAILKEIVKSVPGSEVLAADGSGQIMVKTSREAQAQVRDYILAENAKMLRQAHIQLDVYSVRSNNDSEFGVDMSALYTAVTGREQGAFASPATLTGALAGAISWSFFEDSDAIIPRTDPNTGQALPTTNRRTNTAIINALNEIGTNVQYRPLSLVAMNRQWARKSRLNTISYLSKTTPATGGGLTGGAGLPGLETDEFVTGDQFMAMPYILDNNHIMLKFGVNLSDLIELVDQTTGTGETLQKVQTPNISSINDQFTITLRPGEVMAITGLSREVSSDSERRLAEKASILFGGSDKRGRTKEHFVIFIRGVVI